MKIFFLCVFLFSAGIVRGEQLAKRGWQLHDYDMRHIRSVLSAARELGINEIQLSHNIVHNADEVLEKKDLATDVNSICATAHKVGLKVFIWTHELERVPDALKVDGKVALDNPKTWEWLAEKYEKVFDTCAGIDGVVLTFHETAVPVYDDNRVLSILTPVERVAKLVDTLAAVCKSRGKELVVRTFCYEPHELVFIRDGLLKAKSAFTVMSKCQPHDWQPFYPHNPVIGDVGGRPQIVEFDLGHEFLGQGQIPYIDAEYTKWRLDYGISKGIAGAVIRIERGKNHALGTPNWANVYVLSKLLQDPTQDVGALLLQYFSQEYGPAAAPKVVRAMSRTFDIVNKTFFVLGFWITDHSRIPSYGYALRHIEQRGVDKWNPDVKWKTLKERLMNPDADVLREVMKEKQEALRLCRQSIADIESARSDLSGSDYTKLMEYFHREEAVVFTWSAYCETFFSLRAYETSGKTEFRNRTESAIKKLEQCAITHARELAELTGDGGASNSARIAEFAKEVRQRLAERSVKNTSQ